MVLFGIRAESSSKHSDFISCNKDTLSVRMTLTRTHNATLN